MCSCAAVHHSPSFVVLLVQMWWRSKPISPLLPPLHYFIYHFVQPPSLLLLCLKKKQHIFKITQSTTPTAPRHHYLKRRHKINVKWKQKSPESRLHFFVSVSVCTVLSWPYYNTLIQTPPELRAIFSPWLPRVECEGNNSAAQKRRSATLINN